MIWADTQLDDIEGFIKPMLFYCDACGYCGETALHPGCRQTAKASRHFSNVLRLISDVRMERTVLHEVREVFSDGPLLREDRVERLRERLDQMDA